MSKKIAISGGLRTEKESKEGVKNKICFDKNPESWEKKMENFPKYVRRQNITRFISLYELFKRIQYQMGSIIECGVNQGFGIMSWSKFSSILEPVNLTRKIYGFDTFEGFPALSEKDESQASAHIKKGDLYANSYDELLLLSDIHDSTRFLGHIPKVELIRGNAVETIPKFVDENPHLIVSLLFLDFDLYEPTAMALEKFVPTMPKGSIIVFDELNNPLWPGETRAMFDYFKKEKPTIERFDFDPYIGFISVK